MSRVVQTLRGADLHMEETGLMGPQLADEILKEVKGTQYSKSGLHLTSNLPNVLFLTQQQYESIETDTEALGEVGRMFNTGMNVMEVYVVDRRDNG